jgi:hypothetical protein
VIGRNAGGKSSEIHTLDGINYDFQGHGEFIATKSTTDNFEVQVRQEDVYQSGQASVNTAVGVQTGTDIVCVTVKPNRLFINNQLQNLNGLTTLSLQNGASVSKTTEKGKDLLSITTKNGDIIRVVFQAPEYLDYYLALSENRQGKVIGLIGNYDGDKTNDIVVRNGENILTNGGLSFQKLYPTYADSWRIAQRNSLFYYDAGKTTDSYTEKDFPRSVFTLTNDQKTKAEGICRAAGVSSEPYLSNCIVDVAITNNAALAASALWGQEKNAHEPSPTTEIVPPASSLGSYTFLSGTWRYENGTECLYIPDTKSATLTKLPTNNVFGFVVDEDCWRNVTSSGTNQWTYDQLIRTANGGMTYYKSTAIAKGRDSLSVDTQNFGKYFIVRVR